MAAKTASERVLGVDWVREKREREYIEEGSVRVERTNAQGAGCTAGGIVMKVIEGVYNRRRERIRKWKKGRILEECSQHSRRMRGEVSTNRELCQQTSLLAVLLKAQHTLKSYKQTRSDMRMQIYNKPIKEKPLKLNIAITYHDQMLLFLV